MEKEGVWEEAPKITVENESVVVTDIRMPFGSMVRFMVKWAIASIPAVIILYLLGTIALGVLRGLIGH